MTAPQIDISLSYAAWASTTADPVTLDVRCGSETRRASCPVAIWPWTYSGVPNAATPSACRHSR